MSNTFTSLSEDSPPPSPVPSASSSTSSLLVNVSTEEINERDGTISSSSTEFAGCQEEARNRSILDRYRQIGFIEDVNESSYLWDFVVVPNRLFRVSIPKVTDENAGTDWVHLKVYKDSIGRMELHQITFLSSAELRKVLWRLPGILKQVHEYFDYLEGNVREIVQERFDCPTEAEDMVNAHRTWEICQSPRRKIIISCVYYDPTYFERTFIQFKVFTRVSTTDLFLRRSRLNVRVGEVRNLIDSSCNITESVIIESARHMKAKENRDR